MCRTASLSSSIDYRGSTIYPGDQPQSHVCTIILFDHGAIGNSGNGKRKWKQSKLDANEC